MWELCLTGPQQRIGFFRLEIPSTGKTEIRRLIPIAETATISTLQPARPYTSSQVKSTI